MSAMWFVLVGNEEFIKRNGFNIQNYLLNFLLNALLRFLIGQYVTIHGDVISHVNISRVNSEDGGLYICKVKNRAGERSHGAKLNVYGEYLLKS